MSGEAGEPAAAEPGALAGRRTALVHDWLTGMRGGEKVLAALGAIFPGAPIHTLFHFPGSVSPAIEAHPIRTSFLQRAPGLRRRYRHYLPLFPAAIEDLDLSGADLVVSSSHCVAKGALPPPGAFHLCYCHTPMRYAWDQERAYFPHRRGAVARLRAMALSRLRTWDVASASRVDLFVANSRFVARRIHRYYGRPEEEIEVVAPPVDVDFFTPGPPGPGEGYALAVSALAPYKRLEVAIAACARLGLELRVVGEGPEGRRLAAVAAAAGGRAWLLGRVAPERLRDLYRGALCFVQPGVEDFGIAAVEALACGAPVVALGRGGVTDIVEDGRHGVLYQDGRHGVLDQNGRHGVLDEDVREAPDEAAALAAAIDRARQIRFNMLDLRGRAEGFSAGRFTERIRSILLRHLG
jgi:glycosyltransferase involved in cell wall biosynthesis